ncbi:restriction endonuclease subunit S [Holdemanella biformis]|uniref:restriction endonuclease subunit S n=1 Tax=Holdemanella biformis TaxID=1735 RepID=UPI0020CAEE65|nr:restriction endonuclease subunit S [Holdemanella biformis]
MDKKNKNPNVPNLRFNNDPYKKYNLYEFATRVTRKNKDNVSNLPLTISAQYGLVDQVSFFNKTVASKDMSGYYLLKNGEFAYNKSYSNDYPWGAIKRLDLYDMGCLSTLYICFKTNDNIVNSNYLVHYFESSKWHKQVADIAGEGARNHGLLNIGVNDFFNTKHAVPTIENQIKIAGFLDLIEKRIQTQIKIINDYKILKNHIIKSFIKQNGTSYLLSEIAELGRGRVINSAEISKQKNPIYPVYSSQTSNNGIMGYLDNYDYEGEYITWTTDGANAGTVYYRNGKFNCTNVCGILKIKNGYDAYYISNILNCYTKKYVSTNLANPKLMNNVMANIKINLPSIEQQKHSSKILQSIEYRVEIEEDIKLNLVKQKAFLLKNMFI